MALRDAGWRVVNQACGLGAQSDQRGRREEELREACARAGFELRIQREPLAAEPLADVILAAIEELAPAIVVSPTPGDRHPAHELVAAATQAAITAAARPPRWWTWAFWGALPRPTLATAFDTERLEEILAALAAHRGELARNDYRRLVRGRAEMSAVLAPELLFGFGSATPPAAAYAELLGEVARSGDCWLLGRPRWLDPADPLCEPSDAEADFL